MDGQESTLASVDVFGSGMNRHASIRLEDALGSLGRVNIEKQLHMLAGPNGA